MKSAPKPLDFAPNYNWVSSETHTYAPRSMKPWTRRRLAEAALRHDKGFLHLLRQCKASWIVGIKLGARTVHICIYDPEVVDDPQRPEYSQSAHMADSVFLEVDRALDMQPLHPDRQQRVRTTHPVLYAVRRLRPVEIQFLDELQLSLGDTPPTHIPAVPVDRSNAEEWNTVIPDRDHLHLES